jgi:hypothetical protein
MFFDHTYLVSFGMAGGALKKSNWGVMAKPSNRPAPVVREEMFRGTSESWRRGGSLEGKDAEFRLKAEQPLHGTRPPSGLAFGALE